MIATGGAAGGPARFKVVLVGDADVGKSAFLMRNLTGEFESKRRPTVDPELRSLQFYTNHGTLIFDVWDCPPGHGAIDQHLADADAVMIGFDGTRKETAKGARLWYKRVCGVTSESDKVVPVVVCGFKADVRVRKRTAIPEPDVPYWAISSRSCYNLEMPFLYLSRKLTRQEELSFVEAPALAPPEVSFGFSVGGAKDSVSFKKKIEMGMIPLKSDITFEGVFAEYAFSTSGNEGESTTIPSDELFSPNLDQLWVTHPITKLPEHYVRIGLASRLDARQIARKALNLVITLDISGSMNDRFEEAEIYKPKIEVAKESILTLLDHLNPDDKLGIVLFDSAAIIFEDMSRIADKDLGLLKRRLMSDVKALGGTNMEKGFNTASAAIRPHISSLETHENRIIFLTDAIPTHHEMCGSNGLENSINTEAGCGVFVTFIGVGIDFNTDYIERIVKVKGANYFAVHSSKDFRERMNEGFEYMVNPLLFDLQFRFDSTTFEVEQVYGSGGGADDRMVMNVPSLFPSKTSEEGTKGGLILLKLRSKNAPICGAKRTRAAAFDDYEKAELEREEEKPESARERFDLSISYVERSGVKRDVLRSFALGSSAKQTSSQVGAITRSTRKGILLAHYVSLIHNWIDDHSAPASAMDTSTTASTEKVDWRSRFAEFKDHFAREMEVINDEHLSQELEVLQQLSSKSDDSWHFSQHNYSGIPSSLLAMWEYELAQASLAILPDDDEDL